MTSQAIMPPPVMGSGAAGRVHPWMPARLARGGFVDWAIANAAVAALYFALGLIVSRFFAAYGLFPAPIWLPTGIAFVAAMAGEARVFPGIFLGSFLTNAILFAPPIGVTTTISITNALGPVVGAMIMRRLRPDAGLFTSFYGVVAFVFCSTFLSPAIIATGGALALCLGEPLDPIKFYSIWVNWWLADSGGSLYLAPCLTLWFGLEHESADYAAGTRQNALKHNLAVWLWIAAVSLALFLTPPLRGTYIRAAFPFLLVVPLSWIALRMSLKSAYTLVTLVSIAATAGTVAGFGPFQNQSLANPLQLVGTLVVLLAMNVLTIVALVSERQEAETKNRIKTMLLASASHEIKTPLNAIIGFSSLLDQPPTRPMSEEQQGTYARLIRTSGEHLLALIDGLLEMSKIESGRFDLHEETVPLEHIIHEAAAIMGAEAKAKLVTVETASIPPGISVKADSKALRQILLNLLSNAVKFTPPAGHVHIECERGPAGELVIRIKDTGVGIPPAMLERVFTPFERAHPGTEGTGLGLSITRGLVLLHGGSVHLESEEGQGTTAVVALPAARIAEGGAGAAKSGGARRAG